MASGCGREAVVNPLVVSSRFHFVARFLVTAGSGATPYVTNWRRHHLSLLGVRVLLYAKPVNRRNACLL
jgi:hypothetical protein